ncbi:zinc finger CCCH domain-containing protein 43-like [Arachis ipaensis]|uniref:zinc finger CCCH domain-containing protein 43-like n=1 Tax=Arachis ipaensis TaxID=130454 RepID=UPI000A2B4539|nr:zinc finger CCCH domain-containing protein 43-like [Arachis ipaensis]
MVVRNWVVKVVVPPETGEAQGSDNNDGWDDDEGYGWNANVKESEVAKVSGDFDVDGDGNGDDEVEVEGDEEVEKKKDRSSGRVQQQYPLRPDAEDCAFYLKTGTCKFGFNCKFNHPLGRRKNQVLIILLLKRRFGKVKTKFNARTR